jgi:hypothetical protein
MEKGVNIFKKGKLKQETGTLVEARLLEVARFNKFKSAVMTVLTIASRQQRTG